MNVLQALMTVMLMLCVKTRSVHLNVPAIRGTWEMEHSVMVQSMHNIIDSS